MKNYIYIPVITVLTAVLWFLLTAIFPSETLATWWNGVIWLAVFLVRLALLLVMLAVILLGALFLGLMGFVALDSLNEWINSVTNQTGHMSGLQHLLAGIVIGLIIGVAWIVGMPYTVMIR